MSLPVDIGEKYEVLGQLAVGGMGAVYKVRHRLLDELRVIKVMQARLATSERSKERFHREAKAAIRLRHPNVAQVHDFSVDRQGVAYLVMEFIDGVTLKELLLGRARLPLEWVLEVAMQGLAALEYLHHQGYLHRDIAPDNLMLTRRIDGSIWVKLIDLGLAKEVTGNNDLTVTGTFVGKVRYASPEQFAQSRAPLDPRSDIYSFGVLLYELLTGICPIKGESFEELLASHLLHSIPSFDETDPEGRVPAGVREAVLVALAKKPTDRVQSAAELGALLRPFHAGPAPSFDAVRERHGLGAKVRRLESEEIPTVMAESPAVAGATVPLEGELSSPRRSWPVVGRWLMAAVTLMLVAGLAWRWRGEPRTPAVSMVGQAILDARPWAEVTAVIDVEGRSRKRVGELYTPLILDLEPGSYQVTFEHPDLTSPRVETVEVKPSESVRWRSIDLGVLDSDRYFESVGLKAILERAGS